MGSLDANGNKGCGGSVAFYDNIPKIGGYYSDEFILYFLWNSDVGFVEDYKAKNAVQLYMGEYYLPVTDMQACFDDLVEKLKRKYGEKAEIKEYEEDIIINKWTNKYCCWINPKGGMVGVRIDYLTDHVCLVYMAPGAENKLARVEALVREQEIEDAKGDDLGV